MRGDGGRTARFAYHPPVSDTAADYLREITAVLSRGYPADCVTHACRLVELLLAEGASPWIGRLRDETHQPYGVMHGPLIPKQLTGRNARTWTTHYVACADGSVYDPLAGIAVPIVDYPVFVFGRPIPIETFLDVEETDALSRLGNLKAAFRVDVMRAS